MEPPRLRSSLMAVLRLHLRVLLGLFIVGQFFFLWTYNTVDFLAQAREDKYWIWNAIAPRKDAWEKRLSKWLTLDESLKKGNRADRFVYDLRTTMKKWSRLTGQEQKWSLFAPDIADYTCFVAVELRWDDDRLPELSAAKAVSLLSSQDALPLTTLAQALKHPRKPVLLLSENEPRDFSGYFRYSRFRLRRFESKFELSLRLHGQTRMEAARDDPDSNSEGWGARIRNHVWYERKEMRAYLRWRMKRYLQSHPGAPQPSQVRLLSRTWTIAPPESPEAFHWTWHEDEMNVPMARWLPWKTPTAYPVEYYDPVEDRFESY